MSFERRLTDDRMKYILDPDGYGIEVVRLLRAKDISALPGEVSDIFARSYLSTSRTRWEDGRKTTTHTLFVGTASMLTHLWCFSTR